MLNKREKMGLENEDQDRPDPAVTRESSKFGRWMRWISLLRVSSKLEPHRAALAFSFKISEIWALPRKHLSLSKDHFQPQ